MQNTRMSYQADKMSLTLTKVVVALISSSINTDKPIFLIRLVCFHILLCSTISVALSFSCTSYKPYSDNSLPFNCTFSPFTFIVIVDLFLLIFTLFLALSFLPSFR